MGTEDQTLSMIYLEQEMVYGFQAFGVDETLDRVDFEALLLQQYNLKNANAIDPFVPLEVVGADYKSERYVGEIKNSNEQSIECAYVLALGRDETGKAISIDATFVDNVAAKGMTPFSMYSGRDASIHPATVEYYAYFWH
ncbi:hypothetical protein [[Clostridium] aminophilum]|uniref:Uncharacterized protein n=1 Tax=[Clostridium] aminophilum TaxID=1526 RepID=A0A1I6JJ26_9FIRM|nr:hypothetical protein [[Clostridium] aminophilum]SFR78899.1 hypothetical protein SAMN02910262_01554 [[Clostridium] aminophilum]